MINVAKKKNSKIFGAKKNASLTPASINVKNPANLQVNSEAAIFLAILSFHVITTMNSKNKYQISKILSKW